MLLPEWSAGYGTKTILVGQAHLTIDDDETFHVTNAELPASTARQHILFHGTDVQTPTDSLPRKVEGAIARGYRTGPGCSCLFCSGLGIAARSYALYMGASEWHTDYSIRWALIKQAFTSKAKSWLNTLDANLSRKKQREATVWQRRFWEHTIPDERDFSAHCDYIHYNPVKHGLVDAPRDWPHSTFHRFVKEGLYTEDWGAGPITIGEDIGRK